MIDTKALKEKVLDLAIRGKLVPQDPNDEPASILLERIRAQKQQMVKDGKLKAKDIKNDTVIFKGEDNLHYEQFADGSVKCIEDEIPFEIPDGWAWCRISSISEEIFAGGDKPKKISKEQNEACPYAIYSNGVDKNGLYGFTDISRVVKPSITVSGRGTIGFSCVRYAPFFPIIRLITITPSPLISLEFLDFVFKRLLEKGTGSSILQLTVPMIKPKLIPIPPLKEQQKIVITATGFFEQIKIIDGISVDLIDTISLVKSHILDLAIRGKLVPQDPNDEPASVLLERIRTKKEELIKQGKIKRDKKESVIFKGEDNSYYEKIGDKITCIDDELPFEIPDNWCWARLSSFTEVIMGSSPRSQDICRDSNYTEFHQGKIYFSDCLLKESNQYTKNISKIAPKNSVLLCVRAPVGEVNITDREICIGRGLSSIHAYDKIQSNFLFYWLKTQKHVLVNKSTGSTFSAITVDTVKKILLPIPPITEQLRITQKILDLNSNIESITANLR